jgi:PPK2 family polyphosphate:nucleotide phosphotransferase
MSVKHRFDHKKFRVVQGDKVKLDKVSTKSGKELDKKNTAREALADDVSALQEMQQKLYASNSHSLLVIFQGIDAAGKDGMIRHVMGGVNPQGCRVTSFKAPNAEELEHHFLWRPMRHLPERGFIGIFNRSYYEEVLVVRVHPEFLKAQRIPKVKKLSDLWKQRYDEIVQFENMLTRHGTKIVKFFLHLSKAEQKVRFLDRLHQPEKNWKFSERDLEERQLWTDYQEAFEDMLSATSSKESPWYIIPSDDKWYARAVVADVIAQQLESLELAYPVVDNETRQRFAELAKKLEAE